MPEHAADLNGEREQLPECTPAQQRGLLRGLIAASGYRFDRRQGSLILAV